MSLLCAVYFSFMCFTQKLESLLERVRVNQSKSSSLDSTLAKGNVLKPRLDLNATLDTTLTSLSDLPLLSKSSAVGPSTATRKVNQILSLSIDEILNPNGNHTAAHFLAETEEGNNALSKKKTTERRDSLLSSATPTSVTTSGKSLKAVSAATTRPADVSSNKQHSASNIAANSLKTFDIQEVDNNLYADDFDELSAQDTPQNKDDNTLNDENLSSLSEEITTSNDSDDISLSIKETQALFEASELLGNVITDEGLSQPEDEDYNKMTETDYKKRKAKMEMKFKQKQVKPGDPDFVYDKEVKFDVPKMESGWDGSSDSSDSEF